MAALLGDPEVMGSSPHPKTRDEVFEAGDAFSVMMKNMQAMQNGSMP